MQPSALGSLSVPINPPNYAMHLHHPHLSRIESNCKLCQSIISGMQAKPLPTCLAYNYAPPYTATVYGVPTTSCDGLFVYPLNKPQYLPYIALACAHYAQPMIVGVPQLWGSSHFCDSILIISFIARQKHQVCLSIQKEIYENVTVLPH